jgi:hypothetical protein
LTIQRQPASQPASQTDRQKASGFDPGPVAYSTSKVGHTRMSNSWRGRSYLLLGRITVLILVLLGMLTAWSRQYQLVKQ